MHCASVVKTCPDSMELNNLRFPIRTAGTLEHAAVSGFNKPSVIPRGISFRITE